jgi:DNA-binding IscR family transcriptional regulator
LRGSKAATAAVGLRRPATGITLGQIYKAVESESGVFAMRSQVHKGCLVACAMERRLGPIFDAANDAVEQALSKNGVSRSWYAASAKFARNRN